MHYGFIYKITNKVNNKVYIGQTKYSAEVRFREHLWDFKSKKVKHRALYSAMEKYGTSNFECDTIGVFPIHMLEEKEVYYIRKYKSFKREYGYNMTLGGKGARTFTMDHRKVIKMFRDDHLDMTLISKLLEVDTGTIRRILRDNLTAGEIKKIMYFNRSLILGKKIVMCDPETKEVIQKFNTAYDASRFVNKFILKKTNPNKPQLHRVRVNISRYCNQTRGKTNTVLYGFYWKFDKPYVDRTNCEKKE